MIGWNQEKSHFSNTGKILLKQEFSDGLQISMNIKIFTIPLIIHYYLLRAFRTLHKSFHAKSQRPVFFHCQHQGVGIMQYVYALNLCIVLIIPRTSQKFPIRLLVIVNPGIQWRFIAPWHTLININNMKFQYLFWVCLIFYTYDSANWKASGITPWKKCYSLLRWPCLLQDVLNRRLLFKTNRQQ